MFYASIVFEIFAHKYDFFVQLVQSILKYNRGIDMQNVLLRLREVQPSLSSTERQIAQFILENPDETTTLTIRELARRSFSSPSSVVRICRVIGFQGYKELRHALTLELATLGAQVLPNRSVEMAKKYGVQLVVRSSLNNHEGTIVREEVNMEKMLVSGVAADKNATRIAVIGLKDEPGIAFHLFNALAKYNINVDIILQSVGRNGTKDISFTVAEDEADEAVAIIQKSFPKSEYNKIDEEKDVAKISIVGAGMMTHPGVAASMFEALYDAGVNIKMISTSEIRVTVLIDEKYTEKALNAVHDKFALGD